MQTITIKGSFTSLNEYINAERGNRYAAAEIKKNETERAYWHFKNLPKINQYPIKLEFTWFVKDKRKDPDNISFAKKFILDGMVESGFIKNDGFNNISEFKDNFRIGSDEMVVIHILKGD